MAIIETWKPVSGFVGLYEVSNLGRVRSLKGRHGAGTVLKPKLPDDTRRYPAVSLHSGGNRFRRHVHTLVAIAFLPRRPSSLHEVRHIDGDRSNNRANNLAWGTRKDNADDRAKHGRTARGQQHGMYGKQLNGSANGFAKIDEAKAQKIRQLVAAGMSQRGVARALLVSQKTVWSIVNGKAWVHTSQPSKRGSQWQRTARGRETWTK